MATITTIWNGRSICNGLVWKLHLLCLNLREEGALAIGNGWCVEVCVM